MRILSWVGQIVLFFVAWRLFYYVSVNAAKRLARQSLWTDLAVNLALAIILLIVFVNLKSLWWTMPVVGAAIGVSTAQLVGATHRST